MIPEYIQKIYQLVLVEGYRLRQMDLDLCRGQLTNIYRITFKKKKHPIITVVLKPGKGDGNSWYE